MLQTEIWSDHHPVCLEWHELIEWIMHLYSALLCIAVHPTCFTIMWGGGGVSPQPPPVCSIWMPQDNGASALTTHQLQVERIEPIKLMGIIRRPCLTRASGGNLAKTPLLFTRSAMGVFMTTESQDLGLTSHPKDCAFWQYSVPVTILGR